MRIATYNIQFWTGMDGVQDPERTIAVVQEIGPDVIAMQEVVHPFGDASGESALERVARALRAEYAFGVVWPAGTFERTRAPMGNAVVSRYPILAHANHRLAHESPYPVRWLLEVRLLLPNNQPFTVYATHLEWRSEDVRVQEIRALLQWTTRDRGRPHLLLGDFNSVHPQDVTRYEESGGRWEEFVDGVVNDFPQAVKEPKAIARLLRAGYVDAFAAVGTGDGRTYTCERPTLRLDYCFVDPSLRTGLRRAQRWESDLAWVASDHLPLVVDLEITAALRAPHPRAVAP